MVYLVGLLDVAHLKVEAAGGGQQGRLFPFSMVYLVGLLDVAHLKVEAAGGGQQGCLFFSLWFTLSAFLMLPI
jgi:hypothetical protein